MDSISAHGRRDPAYLPSPARRGSRSRPPLRRPRPLRFERLRVPVWNPYSRGRLGPAKSEDRKGRLAPQLAATPWGGSPPRPLRQKICYSDCTRNCPLCPLRAPRRFRNPKIGQQLGAQPTPRFRVMSEAMSDVEIEALIDPLPPFTFCRPFSFDSKLIW